MGNCVGRETGFDLEDLQDSPEQTEEMLKRIVKKK